LHSLSSEEDSLILDLREYLPGQEVWNPSGQEAGEADTTDPGSLAACDTRPPDPSLPPPIGPYELLEKIGQGGMGVVYKARQAGLNRIVALKLALGATPSGKDAAARFQTECEAIARLEHDNIVRVYDCGEHEGRPYFSMEYIEGGTLARKLAEGPLVEREAAELVQKLARAVHFAHQHNIIHRDLKPGNVLLREDGTVKLTDFGLAKLLDADESQTQTCAVIGTAGYMAPEQARGDSRRVGPLSDVYGLGAILYETLTGRPPFRGSSREETLFQVKSQPPVPPSRLGRHVSRHLEAICLKCLAKAPSRRYPSAEALADDLGRWLRGEPTVARPLTWPTRMWRRICRPQALSSAVAVCALAVACLFAVLYWNSSERPSEQTERNPERPSEQTGRNPERPIDQVERDLDRPIEQIERNLANGQEEVLIGETGGPRWSRPRVPTEPGQALVAPGGAFKVKSWATSLLELVRDPRSRSYRFSAEVRHEDDSKVPGFVGIYVAHRAYDGVPSGIHQFVSLTFNDISTSPRPPLPDGTPRSPIGMPTSLRLFIRGTAGPGQTWENPLTGWNANFGLPAGFRNTPWRKLVVKVTPTKVEGSWEGNPLGPGVPVQKMIRDTDELLTDFADRIPNHPFVGRVRSDFPARGGLGLLVHRGSAAFRSVVVVPLQED
jgi:serine/threonine-protein kinase